LDLSAQTRLSDQLHAAKDFLKQCKEKQSVMFVNLVHFKEMLVLLNALLVILDNSNHLMQVLFV
jgi:2-hydroxy-3-keto-5-methylthiopentenyl-1-phosphate phosphatase